MFAEKILDIDQRNIGREMKNERSIPLYRLQIFLLLRNKKEKITFVSFFRFKTLSKKIQIGNSVVFEKK